MSSLISAVTAILDSTAFRIFFAVWTGVYLVQVIKREAGAPDTSELWWIVIAFAFGIFLV